ncbi:uncharacterized protein LOC132755561 isoform X2 [Ruditapes philippinarum]|uniref:uncharacterized protein LOC132755561 isoform X2 n=1 Tax=Ruditapes philippinarum TaxID=129788 RepID=UPI00295BF7F0|nr:uncharacterized protein LOC132755561 isoform X2 [Ruditapes philippinarum]
MKMEIICMTFISAVIHLFTSCSGVTPTSVFVDSCYRVLELTDDRDKFVLYYDGATITDSRDNRCTPIVKIQYDNSFNEHNFCVELVSAPNTCRNSVVFQSHTCDQIRQNAVCEDSAEVYITFKPWKNLGDVIGDLKIKIYKRTITDARAEQRKESHATLYVGIAVCVFVVVLISVIAVYRRRISRRQNAQPEVVLYHSEEQDRSQTDVTSAGPPSYVEVMAATDQQNNACGTSHTDVSEPTAPVYDNEVQEDPPPPYPGYS